MKSQPTSHPALSWGTALLVAAIAQQCLLWGWLTAGMLLYAVAGIWAIVASRGIDLPAPGSGTQPAWQWTGNPYLLGAGIVLVAGTALLNPILGTEGIPFYIWLIGLVLILASGYREIGTACRVVPATTWLILVALMGYAAVLAFYDLATLPLTVHGDEGMVGIHAREALHAPAYSFFSSSWYNLPQFFFRYLHWACG